MDTSEGWDIENALEAAGSWGRFQKLVLLMSFLSAIPNAFVALHFVFSQYEPRHHCTYPEEYQVNQTASVTVDDQRINMKIIPYELSQRGERIRSQCKMYERNYSRYPVEAWPEIFENQNGTKIVNCMTGMSYELPSAEETAVMEFSMVCDDDWKAPLAVSLYGLGKAVGCIFGVTADWYGRRPVFIVTSVVQILCEVLNALAWNYPVYCIAVTLSGTSSVTNYIVFFVLATEVTDHRWRNFLSIAGSFGFTLGYCSVTLFAYYFRQWRYFIGVMAAVGAMIYLPCSWFFPESPRWLAQKGRSDDAIESLRQIARANKRTHIFEEILGEQEKTTIIAKNYITSSGITETIKVFCRSGIASRFCATAYGWLITAVGYVAFSIYSTDYSQDRFINFFIGGLVEFPSYVVGFLAIKYLGRPRTTLLLMVICGVSSVTLPFIPTGTQSLSAAFAIFGKGANAAVFFAWYLIPTEVFPTLQRSSALSICSTISRIGSFSAPYIMYFRKYNYWMPNVAMGIACISAGFLGIFLIPETLGVPLPDTAQEAKENQRFYGLHLKRKFKNMKTSQAKGMSDDDGLEQATMI